MSATLDERMRSFRAHRPEHPIRYTLFTDHGLDHVEKAKGHVISSRAEVAAAGVRTVGSAAEGRRGPQPWAIAIEHSRTTYVAVHTEESQADENRRAHLDQPQVRPGGLARAAERRRAAPGGVAAGVDLEGRRARRLLRLRSGARRRLARRRFESAGIGLAGLAGAGPFTPFSDEQLFAATSGGAYPDLFFRARTALEAVSVDHGSMARAASEGTLATQSRALPQYTRSDNVLALFPALRAHLEERHGPLLPGDANAGLPGQE